MEKKKTDRRIRKTKAQLRKGILELLKKKSIQEITVQELVDEVDMNRSTFYLHYRDIYDLLEQIENDYYEKFNEFIMSHRPTGDGSKPQSDQIIGTFIDYFEFLKENEDLITVLIGYNGDPAFSRHQIKLLTQNVYSGMYDVLGIQKNQKSRDIFEYCTYGAIGLVRNWVTGGYAESPESIGRLTGSIIMNTVQQFLLGGRETGLQTAV